MYIKATICIPTYNGQDYIDDILKMLFVQNVDYKYEVLIIDSGSTDNTLNIINKYKKKHPNLRLHQIPNSEFGHGKTRNLAAKMANGEFIVYLSHDAIPASSKWLSMMLSPFEISKNIVAVLGKQVPRQHCVPMLKYEINQVFSQQGSDTGITLYSRKKKFSYTTHELAVMSFYSDVNSASRKKFIVDIMPYKDVSYSEDMIFGKDIIEAEYTKAYTPFGSVIHSNDVSLNKYKNRLFDETYTMLKTTKKIPKISLYTTIKIITKGALVDTVRILRDNTYSYKRKLYWLVINPLFHIEKWRGIRLAYNNYDEIDISKYSLEHKEKSPPNK